MNARRLFLPTLALSLLLIGFCTYVTVSPAEIRARSAPARPLQGAAILSFVSGRVEVRAGKAAWTALRQGDALRPGDTVRTGRDGRAELLLQEPWGRLRLEKETVFTLERDRDGGRFVVTGGQVSEGSAWAKVTPRRAGESPFVLSTSVARAAAEGTVYRVHVLEPDVV